MSIPDTNEGWSEVERRAVAFANEQAQKHIMAQIAEQSGLPLLTITEADRLKGAIIAAMGELEQGHHTAAWQILNDRLNIGGVK